MNKKTESGAVTEDDFLVAFEQTIPIKVNAGREMKETLETIRCGLSSKIWEKRVEQLRHFRGVVKGTEAAEDVMTLLRAVESELGQCVMDLRSQIVREACICVAYLSVRLGARLEPLVEALLSPLVTLVPNGARVMASSGKVALRILYKHTQTKRLLTPLCFALASSRSPAIRQCYCELLLIICTEWQHRRVESSVAGVCDALRKGICDADTESRTQARRAFMAFHARFEGHAAKLMLGLDAAKRTQLQKELATTEEERICVSRTLNSSDESVSKRAAMPKKEVSREVLSDQSQPEVVAEPRICTADSSLREILAQMKCRVSKERKDAMERMQRHMVLWPLSQDQVRVVLNEFGLCFIENDREVRQAFLELLAVFLKKHLNESCPWLESLLVKLLQLRVGPHRQESAEPIEAILGVISSRALQSLVRHSCEVLVREGASLTAEVCVGFCELLLGVMSPACLPASLPSLVGRLVSWTVDSRHPRLGQVAAELLRRLKQDGPSNLEEALSSLPFHTRGRLSSTLGHPGTPSKIPTSPRSSLKSVARRAVPTSPLARAVLSSRDLNVLPTVDEAASLAQAMLEMKVAEREASPPKPPVPTNRHSALRRAITDLANILSRDEADSATEASLRLLADEASLALSADALAAMCAILCNSVDHPSSSARKQSIILLVALHAIVGDSLWAQVPLNPGKRALFDVYMKKSLLRPMHRL